VGADLKSYCGAIAHARLMALVEGSIGDSRFWH
jgi:hypothetical protein